MTDSRGQRQGDELFALFMQKSADGSQRFRNEDIRHFLPLVIISIGYDLRQYPAMQEVMNEFVPKLGVAANADAETYSQAIRRYYKLHPVNRELEYEFLAYCRAQAVGELDADKVRAYAKTAGLKLANQSPIRGVAAPSGGGLGLRARR
jgi:hypothetical protein